MKLRRITAAVGTSVGVLALTGSALADTTLTATVGPVPIPRVPAQVCVVQTDLTPALNQCVQTPPGDTVALTVAVQVPTPTLALVPPTITPAQCPAGTQGVALKVNTGSAGATIGGTATVTLVVNGVPVTQQVPVNPVVAGPNQTVTVFACAGVAPGV